MKKILHYDANTKGRDFVVGDLHGCLVELKLLLGHVNFDKSVDRLFSVGDLVDRGPNSVGCLRLINEPWFHCVQGNHEELMWESVLNNSGNHAGTWMGNGGQWFIALDPPTQLEVKQLCEIVRHLPLVITVGEGDQRFNIVHAEIYSEQQVVHEGKLQWIRIPITDRMIDHWAFEPHQEGMMLWGRSIVSGGKVANPKWHDDKEMSLTFVGHTPVTKVIQYGRQIYIDGGGVFTHYNKSVSHDNSIILVEPATKKYYRLGVYMGNISEHDLDTVEKWAI